MMTDEEAQNFLDEELSIVWREGYPHLAKNLVPEEPITDEKILATHTALAHQVGFKVGFATAMMSPMDFYKFSLRKK